VPSPGTFAARAGDLPSLPFAPRSSRRRSTVTSVDEVYSAEAGHHRRHGLVTAVVAWCAVVLVWALISGTVPISDEAHITFIAAALTTLGLIGAASMSRELGVRTALARLKLGPWMAIGFAVGFGLATLVWLGGNIEVYHGRVTGATLAPAAVVAGIGFVAFLISYRSTPRLFVVAGSKLDARLRGRASVATGAGGVWALWGVAAAAQAVGIAGGNLGYLSDPTAQLSTSSSLNAVVAAVTQLGLLATLVAAWRLAAHRSFASALLLTWIAGTQVVLGLFSGGKEAVFIQFVAFVIGYSTKGRLRLGPVLLTGLVALFVVTPFITAYRSEVLTGSGRLTPAEAISSIDFTALFADSTSGASAGHSNRQAAERLSRIGDIAIIVTETPRTVPFVSPLELLSGPVLGFVPRSIWPGKPVLDAGYQASIAYYGVPSSVHSSSALTPYGDLYRHGGIIVVFGGMSLLGMFVRVVDDRDGGDATSDPRMIFLPMLLFTTLVKQEMDYLSLSASVVSIALAASLGARIVSRQAVRRPESFGQG